MTMIIKKEKIRRWTIISSNHKLGTYEIFRFKKDAQKLINTWKNFGIKGRHKVVPVEVKIEIKILNK